MAYLEDYSSQRWSRVQRAFLIFDLALIHDIFCNITNPVNSLFEILELCIFVLWQ